MAVKSSATETLCFMVDIKSVCRYYKLQASTASAPAKPTANPPSGWTTGEPTYGNGSTDTLYVVDLTVFTNNTYSYSDVSKSSAYEAAKAAYNKAQNAADTADNAKKTATDYIGYTDEGGLVIGKMGTSELGKNVRIDADSVDIRDGSDVIASFEASSETIADVLTTIASHIKLFGKNGITQEIFTDCTTGYDGTTQDVGIRVYDDNTNKQAFVRARVVEDLSNPSSPSHYSHVYIAGDDIFMEGNLSFIGWRTVPKGTYEYIIEKPSFAVYGQSYYLYTIPLFNADSMNIRIAYVEIIGLAAITGNCSIDSLSPLGVTIKDTNTNGNGYPLRVKLEIL